MNGLLKRYFLAVVLFIVACVGLDNKANGQNTLYDSLRKALSVIDDNTADEKLKHALREIQVLCSDDTVTVLLETKLISVEILLKNLKVNQDYTLYFFEVVARLFRQIPPYGERFSYVISLTNLANLYRTSGRFEKALSSYQELLAIRKKISGDENPNYAGALELLAYLYSDVRQYEKELATYQEAVAIRKKTQGEEHPDYVRTLGNMALLYQRQGLYEKALRLYEEMLAIQEKKRGEKPWDYEASLTHLANLYKQMGRHEKALLTYQKVLAIRRQTAGKDHPAYAAALQNLASFYYSTAQYDKALPLYKEATTIWKKTKDDTPSGYARALDYLVASYQSLGQYERALPLCIESLAIYKKTVGEEHPAFVGTLNSLGTLYLNLGNNAEAVSPLVQASVQNLKFLINIFSNTYKPDDEKINRISKDIRRFGLLPSLLFTQNFSRPSLLQQVYLNELTTKGMLLESQKYSLHVIRKSRDSNTLTLYRRWCTNRTNLGNQLLLPIKQRKPDFDSLQKATVELEQQLFRSTPAFRDQLQGLKLTLKDISTKLSVGEASVEFMRFTLFNKQLTDSVLYAALVLLPNDSMPRFIPLFEEKELKRLLTLPIQQLYGNKKQESVTNNSGQTTNPLYRLIWRPLEKYLDGIHTVSYAPAGLLHRVAFHALRADSTQLLMDKYRLNQVLSTRSVAFPVDLSKKPASASIWGDINYNATTATTESGVAVTALRSIDTTFFAFLPNTREDSSARGKELNPLPWTRQEIDSLSKVFANAKIPFATHSGRAATEEEFKAFDGKSPQVVHLATHGFFLPVKEAQPTDDESEESNAFIVQQNPLFRSGLILAGGNRAWIGKAGLAGEEDGILTAYEIAQMDLSNTDLVVLSACETALGDIQGNEGVIGLQRAFKMAGVKQMLLSLWRVSDKTTMELMTLFYRNWLSGQTTREALRNAQLKMKEKYPPFYWAGFVLIE